MFNEIASRQKIWFAVMYVIYGIFFFLPHTGLGPGYALDFATPRNAAQTCFMFPWMCHN